MSTVDTAIDHLLNAAANKKIAVEVLANERRTTKVSIRSKTIEQFAFSDTRQVGVRVINGANEGIAYSENLEPASLDSMFDEAVSNSKVIKKDFEATLRESGTLPKMDFIYNPALETVTPEQKILEATEMESAAYDFDTRITNVAWAIYQDSWIRNTIANSNGLRSSFQANSCTAGVMCLAQDTDGNVSERDFTLTRNFSTLGAKDVARIAAKKTLDRLGARRPMTGKYTIVLENRIAEDLLAMLSDYFSAKAIDEGTSPLKGKLGQKVFSSKLTMIDDPTFKLGAYSRPFDDEGYTGKAIPVIDKGVVANFFTNSVLAAKMKLPHTAHAARSPSTDLGVHASNLIVTPGSATPEQLLNSDTRVILISNVLGTAGFRAASGDFSIPVEGFLYENGKPLHALKDFLISGNILQLFNGVEAVGDDVLMPLGAVICPSLLIRDVNVAGAS